MNNIELINNLLYSGVHSRVFPKGFASARNIYNFHKIFCDKNLRLLHINGSVFVFVCYSPVSVQLYGYGRWDRIHWYAV